MNPFLSEADLINSYRNKGGLKTAIVDIKKLLHIHSDSFKSWAGLFTLITEQVNNPIQSVADDFFTSEEAKLIFALTKLNGEARAEILGITPELYSSLSKSKKWKEKIVSIIHPDRCKHPLSNNAVAELNKIYSKMKKYGE